MTGSSIYHENALAERATAEMELLPLRRIQRERSAECWEGMARQAEELERQSAINLARRNEQPFVQLLRRLED